MLDLFLGRISTPTTRTSTTYLFNGLRCLGLNAPSKWKCLYYLCVTCINFSAAVILPLTFNLSFLLLFNKMSTSQFLASLQAAINVCGYPLKAIAIKIKINNLREAENLMDALDERCHLAEEYRKIQNCIKFCSRITILFVCLYMQYSLMACVSSILMGQPPYSLYLMPLDWRNSNWEFIVQCLIEFMLITYVCFIQSMVDCYTVIYIYIMRTHMHILVERVRLLATESTKSKDKNYEDLVQCIQDHQNLIDLHGLLSPVISVTIFVQFIITAAVLGATMINIFIFADTSSQFASVVYLIAVFLQTSPCCYMATCLLDDCEQLPLAILQCNWMGEDKRFRQMLIFFMQRAQRPLSLAAMKLFPITLNTNLSIAKFSFSLYTLIKNMDFGKN